MYFTCLSTRRHEVGFRTIDELILPSDSRKTRIGRGEPMKRKDYTQGTESICKCLHSGTL